MSGFKDNELLLIGGRELATVGGRLRVCHEANERLTIKTELVDYELGGRAVVRAEVTTSKGTFTATGTATAERDAKVADALVEVAETRSVARALRFAGAGFEVGVEELGDHAIAANAVPDARGQVTPPPWERPVPVELRERRPRRTATPATAAQRRCIDALARRVHIEPGALVARFSPGLALEELDISSASRVIDGAKRASASTANGGVNGANGEGR